MKRYIKQIDIRWSDLDANRHVSNTAYVNFLDHTRMSFFSDNGFHQGKFTELNFGLVIFNEHFFYIKEVMPGTKVHADIEVLGCSDDYKLVQFCHSIYNHDGDRAVFSHITFSWIDLTERKLTYPPKELINIINRLPKAENFKTLTKSDVQRPDLPQEHSIVSSNLN